MSEETKDKNPQPVDTKKRYPSVMFVAEFGDAKNRNFLWNIDQRELRGRWKKSNLPRNSSFDERFAGMPDIPGMVLSLKSDQRRARFYDPLGRPENKNILELAKKVCLETFGTKRGPAADIAFDHMTDDDIKSFCYWARRFLDMEQLTVVNGTVPKMDEIRTFPGKVLFSGFDSDSETMRLRDVPTKYTVPTPDLPQQVQDDAVLVGDLEDIID